MIEVDGEFMLESVEGGVDIWRNPPKAVPSYRVQTYRGDSVHPSYVAYKGSEARAKATLDPLLVAGILDS